MLITVPGRACVHKDLALSDSTHDRQASPCLRCVNVHTSVTESLAGDASSALGQVFCGCGSVFVRQHGIGGHCSVYAGAVNVLRPSGLPAIFALVVVVTCMSSARPLIKRPCWWLVTGPIPLGAQRRR